jgi:hypothetical protein
MTPSGAHQRRDGKSPIAERESRVPLSSFVSELGQTFVRVQRTICSRRNDDPSIPFPAEEEDRRERTDTTSLGVELVDSILDVLEGDDTIASR